MPWPEVAASRLISHVAKGELIVAIHGPRHDGHILSWPLWTPGHCVVAARTPAGLDELVRSKLFPVRTPWQRCKAWRRPSNQWRALRLSRLGRKTQPGKFCGAHGARFRVFEIRGQPE